jgi:hypothetical protein
MSVPKRLRFEVLRRDDHRCRYCGASASDVRLTIDHVIPVALGGADQPENLVAACFDCNAGKASAHPNDGIVSDVAVDALRWAQAMKFAARMQREDVELQRQRQGSFGERWHEYCSYYRGVPAPRVDIDWRRSIENFWKAGLDGVDIDEAVRRTMENPRVSLNGAWRYFCGLCWSVLRERREIATGFIKVDDALQQARVAA